MPHSAGAGVVRRKEDLADVEPALPNVPGDGEERCRREFLTLLPGQAGDATSIERGSEA